MTLILDPGPGRKIASRFNIDGPNPITQISPEAVGVVILDDLSGAEFHDTAELREAIGGANVLPSVGDFSHCQILNPAGSGVDAFVDAVSVTADNAGAFQLREHDASITTLSTEVTFRDTRVTGRPVTQVRSERNAAAIGSLIQRYAGPANETLIIPLGLILSPGNGFLIIHAVTNTNMSVGWFWAERVRPRQ